MRKRGSWWRDAGGNPHCAGSSTGGNGVRMPGSPGDGCVFIRAVCIMLREFCTAAVGHMEK